MPWGTCWRYPRTWMIYARQLAAQIYRFWSAIQGIPAAQLWKQQLVCGTRLKHQLWKQHPICGTTLKHQMRKQQLLAVKLHGLVQNTKGNGAMKRDKITVNGLKNGKNHCNTNCVYECFFAGPTTWLGPGPSRGQSHSLPISLFLSRAPAVDPTYYIIHIFIS